MTAVTTEISRADRRRLLQRVDELRQLDALMRKRGTLARPDDTPSHRPGAHPGGAKMPVRPDLVTLLLDTDPDTPLSHRDGRRFTPTEITLALSATREDHAAAAEFLSHPGKGPMTEPAQPLDGVVFRAALRLIRSTPDAANLEDVARIHGRSIVTLLAAQSGASTAQVRDVIERNPTDYISGPATA